MEESCKALWITFETVIGYRPATAGKPSNVRAVADQRYLFKEEYGRWIFVIDRLKLLEYGETPLPIHVTTRTINEWHCHFIAKE